MARKTSAALVDGHAVAEVLDVRTGAVPSVAGKVAERSAQSRLAVGWRRYRWLLLRVGLGVLTVFLVSLVIFGATVLLPGDAAQTILGQNASPERVDALRERMGLNDPPLTQYLSWIGGILHGDFGTSLLSSTPVIDTLAPRIANTLVLLGFTAVIGFPIAIGVGIFAALKPGGVGDAVVNAASIVIAALPEFVIGILLVLAFATGGFQLFPAVSIVPSGTSPLGQPLSLVLPVATLVIVTLPYLSRQVRASLHDILSSEFVVMADLKGLSRRVVVMRHALRNGLPPVIQSAALALAYLLGGTVVIETIFQYPGMGLALSQSVSSRDVPTVQAIVLIMAIGYVLFNIVADFLTVFVTPKLRTL